MKLKLKVGQKYKIKNWMERPIGWNGVGPMGTGDMDHFRGQTVTIRSYGKGSVTIKEDDRVDTGPGNKKIWWYFNYDDFEEIEKPFKFDERLFEI